VAVLLMSVLFGLESPTRRTAVVVLAISAGVALASYGEIDLYVSPVAAGVVRPWVQLMDWLHIPSMRDPL
jgi:drug/metabolite transporter (DMT)-like permease